MKTRNRKAAELLFKTPLFSSLPPDELKAVVKHLSEVRYFSGKTLSVQGRTKINRILMVKTGTLELFDELQGKRILSGRLEQGDVFGGISILMNAGLSIRTAIVKTDASFYALPKKKFLELSSRYPEIYEYAANTFSKKMLDESYASVLAVDQAVHFLSGVVPFSFLPENELQKIAAELSTVSYPKETVLFMQDRSALESVYLIQKGAVERYYEKEQKKILSGLLGEGNIFGGISVLLNDGISVRTVKAVEDTYFYALPKQRFLDICRRHEVFSEFFTDTFGKRMLDRSYAEIFKKSIQPKEETLQFFNQSIETIYSRDLVSCDTDLSIQQAADLMSRRHCSCIFIRAKDKGVVGVVTDNDLRRKVIARRFDINRPVSEIMSTPLTTVPSRALIFEGLMIMMQKNIKHLAVTGATGRVIGVVTNQDLLSAQGQSPVFLIREIRMARRFDQIADKFDQVPKLIQSLLSSGAKAKNVTRLITTVSDSILDKIIRFSLDESGPPPVRFAFMIMGSEGRNEQTLKTDQDNAIVFEDVADESESEVKKYFIQLGEKICNRLDKAGYAFCTGGVMAKNPKWCQSLSKWKKYFSNWIHAAAPEDLLYSSIFFDFRKAYGDTGLVAQLHRHLFHSLIGWEGFFRHLTENALRFKPPLGFFRNFVVASKGEHRNAFNIKSAMMPIVDFARIYSLKNQLAETNTLERLHQLWLKNVLTREEYHDLEQSYSFLMQLRFVRQVTAVIEDGEKPDNYIKPKKLSGIEQKMLKEIFKRIEKFQAKLEFDFMGTIGSTV